MAVKFDVTDKLLIKRSEIFRYGIEIAVQKNNTTAIYRPKTTNEYKLHLHCLWI
jgi:hypothetical protein